MTQATFSFDDLPQIPLDPSGTVILLLKRSCLGEQRSPRTLLKLDPTLESKVDKAFLSMMARIYSSPELKAIERLDSQTTAELSSLALPCILRTGSTWILPLPMIPTVDSRLAEIQTLRAQLVTLLVRAFATRVDETRAKLGPIADQFAWLTPEQVASRFAFAWRYYSLGLPASLENFDPLLNERVKAQLLADAAEQSRLIVSALQEAGLTLLARLENNLITNPEGGTVRFYDTALENVRAFLETLPKRQIVPDPQFTALMDDARTILGGVTPKAIRTQTGMADAIRESVTRIVDGLESMTGLSVRRKIRLTDNDDDEQGDPPEIIVVEGLTSMSETVTRFTDPVEDDLLAIAEADLDTAIGVDAQELDGQEDR